MSHRTTRRAFLAAGSAALAVGSAALAAGPADAPSKPLVIDTHVHCFAGSDDASFPYHANAPYRPAAALTPEHLLNCMDGADIQNAVIVHPEPYQDDHRYLEHCLNVGGDRLKGTCLVFPGRPGALKLMRSLVAKLDIVAARVHAFRPDRIPPVGKPELRDWWKQAADLHLAVQLHFAPAYAAGFEPLIREFQGTPVVIDHLGRLLEGTATQRKLVVGWSRYKNTMMKLSSFTPGENQKETAALVRELTDAYGPERMIFGGGFGEGATPETLLAYRRQALEYLAHLSSADQAKILGTNAARLFRFA